MPTRNALARLCLAAVLMLGADSALGQDNQEEAHPPAAAESEGANPLAVDIDLGLWTAVVFGVLLLVLWKVAWGPIVEALEAREEGINSNIAAAENAHQEAKQLLAQHEAKLAGAADEVRGLLEEARRDAEATKASIVAEARDAADAERRRALREIESARAGAIKDLAEHSAHLAIDLASKVIRQDITQERQGEIVREAVGRIASSEPSSN